MRISDWSSDVCSSDLFDAKAAEKQAGVLRLINYYRMRGHQAARLDPLGLAPIDNIPDLDPAHHGLGPEDLETVFNTGTLASGNRSEEHTSELQSLMRISYAVFCLKKKNKKKK